MKPEYCITFAGPVGCSKSPVAHHISMMFDWPIFSNDAIRHEVLQDTLKPDLDLNILDARIEERTKLYMQNPSSLVYDASQDRHWDRFVENFAKKPPYQVGIISFDLSRSFYKKLLVAQEYESTLSRAKQLLASHAEFVREYNELIICSITDENFHDRLQVAEDAVRKFISDKTD